MSRQLRLSICASVLILASIPSGATAEDGARTLEFETKISLGPVLGRIDHLAADASRKHVFVAELENNSMSVVDLGSGTLVRRVTGLNRPQGVGYVSSADRAFVASGGDGTVRSFRGADLEPMGKLDLGKDADNVRVDGESGFVYVGYGGGALAVIDPISFTKVKEIGLPAHPESFQISRTTQRVFVNLPDAQSIVEIDSGAGRQVASWPIGEDRGNFAMALDDANRRVIVVFRDPPRLSIRSMSDGAHIKDLDTCGDVDDVFFDSKRQRIYVTCGEGFIDVFDARTEYQRTARITTRQGARTSLFIPELDRLALAVRASETEPAALWIYRASPE